MGDLQKHSPPQSSFATKSLILAWTTTSPWLPRWSPTFQLKLTIHNLHIPSPHKTTRTSVIRAALCTNGWEGQEGMTGIPGEELSDPTPSFYEKTSMIIKPHHRNPLRVCKQSVPTACSQITNTEALYYL